MSEQTNGLERIVDGGVVAVLRGVTEETVVEIARALAEGGVTAVEVTADTPGAMRMIEELSTELPEWTAVGVGTVLDSETARAASLAGAEFVITPTLDPEVIETANRYGLVVMPGVFTPTEALRAYEAGADAVKLFPASSVGPGHIESIHGPLGQIPIIPTGGVDLENATEYVEAGALAVGTGSALVSDSIVDREDWDALTERAREFVGTVEAARGERGE
ncbi:bifunctional 4-hydroxy-2-oxoglutarate aldolase/2-dehydro-3-deoxy-phosphogluconate aldolase [Natronorarus salvus]|uniref:bifunctional 4-hydroxy-2-oxoglutarate aldolase/2-dehydro-3-deoxy-phosphogluconate aldolase n=1 Tax=Natronorarus salvus TaxID=3117733 RepID=UPI002F268C4B